MSTFSNSLGISQPKQIPGTGYKQLLQEQFTPEQMQLFKQMFSQVGPQSYLSRLASGDQQLFKDIEAPALGQFGALQGSTANRFSGIGTRGARRSSGFQNYMGQEATNLAERLQAQRQGLQRQALSDLMGISQQLLGQRPYETHYIAPEEEPVPLWRNLVGGGLPIAGGIAGGLIGSAYPGVGTLAGAKLGGTLGAAAGKAFM